MKKFSEPVAKPVPWPDPPPDALEVPTAEMERPPGPALTVPAPDPAPWPYKATFLEKSKKKFKVSIVLTFFSTYRIK